jgi:hypothetical protein
MRRAVRITPSFQNWQWTLVQALRGGIEDIFATEPDEVKCVDRVVNEIQKAPSFRMQRTSPSTYVDLEAAFLHGHRSQVAFQIGGVDYQRELADVLILGSYVFNGSLRWQRACFV